MPFLNTLKTLTSIPGGRQSVNTLKTKSQAQLGTLAQAQQLGNPHGLANKAIQAAGSARGMHDKALGWVRGQLGYSTESIGDSSNYGPMPKTIKNQEWNTEKRNERWPIESRGQAKVAGNTSDYEMKPRENKHTIGESVSTMPDIEHFIANYVGNDAFGEPLLADRFLVAITNPKSATSENVLKNFGGPATQGEVDKITFFACRTTAFPGKEISTYQYTTHGAESDYPYIASYDNIDLSFTCSAASAIERRWFDGWMASVIDPESMSVGYKDDYSTSISIAIM